MPQVQGITLPVARQALEKGSTLFLHPADFVIIQNTSYKVPTQPMQLNTTLMETEM
jgi:hypothetical protein